MSVARMTTQNLAALASALALLILPVVYYFNLFDESIYERAPIYPLGFFARRS